VLGNHLVDVGDLLLRVQLGINRNDLDAGACSGGDKRLLERLKNRLSALWVREPNGVLLLSPA
jgi:hypothetical protein